MFHNYLNTFLSVMGETCPMPITPIITDGRLHRYYATGDKLGTLNLAIVFHPDKPISGWWLYFPTGATGTWSASGKRVPLTADKKKQIESARAERQAENDKAHQLAAEKARYIWAKSTRITEQSQHPYLTKKRVKPHGTGLYKGVLVIPLLDEAEEIVNLQFISPNGGKRFLSGGKKKGCYYLLGGDSSKLLVAEGFATACSLNEQTLFSVYVAFDCGNLKDVALLAAKHASNAGLSTEIIVCGDNDPIGVEKATQAALLCNGKVLIPPIPGFDWNDYAVQGGAV